MLETLLDYTLLYIVTSFRQRLVEKCWYDLGLVSQLEATVMYFQHLNKYIYIYSQVSTIPTNWSCKRAWTCRISSKAF